MPRLVAVCVVHSLRPDSGSIGVTAIDKRPLEGKVRVGKLGLRSDVQASRKHHGGPEKAVYAYAQDDADFWEGELDRELRPGWFGENLRVEGLDVNGARIGEVWRIGDTVELEVTMPRTPCATFARWVGGSAALGWVKRFSDEGRLGAYLRVRRAGEIRAGDAIEVLSSPHGAPTVLEVYRS
ncbi:MOSC domain-containing protein YiiM [Microbacterium testaceum StLB037]|uniref:MOSC domain-containing protein YiiM n=1 Tax=Microbacterium testaceum (strain StLB037) TaxID=979556 RepID=A0A1H0S920_MICTS|nr:MOSC domain-containing protein [Microbacterium testaceum]SDP38282.1 MOSC domain-containing protein YiiM [Microbacterium testaceum StLB037]